MSFTTSLLLDQLDWDLVTDLDGNIALASTPYAQSQDVACALKLFRGECWYDTSRGVPYLGQILGELPPVSFIKAQFANAALSVPGIASATVFLSSLLKRSLSGQVLSTLETGQTVSAAFSNSGQQSPNQFIIGISILGGGDVI